MGFALLQPAAQGKDTSGNQLVLTDGIRPPRWARRLPAPPKAPKTSVPSEAIQQQAQGTVCHRDLEEEELGMKAQISLKPHCASGSTPLGSTELLLLHLGHCVIICKHAEH